MRVVPLDTNDTSAPPFLSQSSINSSSSEYSDSSTRNPFLLIGKDSSEDVELKESISVEPSPSEEVSSTNVNIVLGRS